MIAVMERSHDAPNRIRIFLAGIPPMLSDIVRNTVANEPDMTVVAEFSGRRALIDALEADGGDVVIVGTKEPEEPSVPIRMLAASPHIKVLMLEIRGRSAAMYELRPHRRSLGDVSPKRLIQAIRQRGKVAGEIR
jgi:DNA-binding NarL/FixJ family response regulator